MKVEKFIDHMYNCIAISNCGEMDCERCPTAKVIIRECIPKFKAIVEEVKEKTNKVVKKNPDKKDELIKAANNQCIKLFKSVLDKALNECKNVSGQPENCRKILKKKIQRLDEYIIK